MGFADMAVPLHQFLKLISLPSLLTLTLSGTSLICDNLDQVKHLTLYMKIHRFRINNECEHLSLGFLAFLYCIRVLSRFLFLLVKT